MYMLTKSRLEAMQSKSTLGNPGVLQLCVHAQVPALTLGTERVYCHKMVQVLPGIVHLGMVGRTGATCQH